MKKTIIAALALLLASCTGEISTEHLSIMGAQIGMPKAEALDSIRAKQTTIGEVVDKYDRHSLDYVEYLGAVIPRVDLIWADDTLRSIKYKFTSFDDVAAEVMYSYLKDSTQLGKVLGLTDEYGSTLAGVSVYEDTNPFDGERLNILIDPSGMYKDAPIIRPTDEQLNLGAVTLGMDEQDARIALRRAYGRPYMEEELFTCYELVFDLDFTWKEATYYFANDKLRLCSYDTYEHSKEEAYNMARTLALAGVKKYRFLETTDKGGNIYYASRVKYYVDREDFVAEEKGSYHPIATIEVKKGKKGYYVNASYQYSEN